MARKTKPYRVETEGRDKGKLFLLSEMPSEQAEAWAMRALLALMDSGVDIPENAFELGMAGFAEIGFKALAKLKWEVAQPLLTEMFECVTIIPDPSKTHVSRPLIPDDVEEIATRLHLRMEVFELHTGFSIAAGLSTSPVAGMVNRAARRQGTRTSRK